MPRRKITAIILAAGLSSRMQGGAKLLAPLGGIPLIRHSVKNICETVFDEIIVVIGHNAKAIIDALDDLACALIAFECRQQVKKRPAEKHRITVLIDAERQGNGVIGIRIISMRRA